MPHIMLYTYAYGTHCVHGDGKYSGDAYTRVHCCVQRRFFDHRSRQLMSVRCASRRSWRCRDVMLLCNIKVRADTIVPVDCRGPGRRKDADADDAIVSRH